MLIIIGYNGIINCLLNLLFDLFEKLNSIYAL